MNPDMENSENKGDGKGLDPKVERYVEELLAEKHALDPASHAHRLIQEEIDKTITSGKRHMENRYLNVYHEKPALLKAKVLVPVDDNPRFNFVGKLLGPKGNTFKRLQEETQTRMAILGRGSMKDKEKEEELRKGLDPKFAHLSDILHVEVSALAAPAEAYARLAYALAEMRKYLVPDSNDEIGKQQFMELGYDEQGYGDEERHESGPPAFRGRGRGAPRGRGDSYAPRGGGPPRGRGAPRGGSMGGSYAQREDNGPPSRGAPRGRGAPFRGSPRGRGTGGPPRRSEEFYSDDHDGNGFENLGGNQSYSSGDYNSPQASYGGSSDYARRNSGGVRGGADHRRSEEQWKPRGGGSRFTERPAPYSRRP